MPQPILQLGLTSQGSFYVLANSPAGTLFRQEGVQRSQDASAGGSTAAPGTTSGTTSGTGAPSEQAGKSAEGTSTDPKKEQQEPACGQDMLLMMGGMFVIVYFLMLRPQKKQEKARKAMLAELGKGDKIVTNAGIHCEIVAVHSEEGTITVKFGNDAGQRMKLDRSAIGRVPGGEPTPEKKG